MSTNLLHVLTAIGDSAAEIQAVCDDLLGKRVEREPGSRSTEDRFSIHATISPMVRQIDPHILPKCHLTA